MPSKARFMVTLVICTVGCAAGCNSQRGNNVTTPPLVKQIYVNPNINSVMRQGELRGMQAHQMGGRLRGRLLHSTNPVPPK